MSPKGRKGIEMTKQEALSHWRTLPENVNPLASMEAIPDKARGSKYGACGIRIDGTPEFIDAVLGRLKGLIDGENNLTRLELARREVMPVEINGETKTFANAEVNAEVCYIRLHERGRAEGKRASVIMDTHLHAASKRYLELR